MQHGIHSSLLVFLIVSMNNSLHVLPFPSKNGCICMNCWQKSLFVINQLLKLSSSIYKLLSMQYQG